jgi:UDP-glucose 4-epimerase
MRGSESNLEDCRSRKNFSFIKMDVNDIDELCSILKKHKIDYIFHLAANSDILASSNSPSIEFDSTAKTTWSVLSAMRQAGVSKLFFASTSAVYGEMHNGKPFKEDDELNPISYYGSAKGASEAFIKAFSYMNNFDALIFRFPNVIGPNLTHGVFYDFINKLKANPKELRVLGDGSQCKPYMHVDDLINAILSLCWDNKGVNVYNVGVETATSVKSIASMVINEMGLKDCKISYGNENRGWKGDVPVFSYCLDKIHSTGWKATMTSDQASLRTIREALEK